ncbi:glycosyltransferase [Caulobacter segnis]
MNSTLGFWLWWTSIKPRLFWTYSPLTTALFKTEGYAAVVYHAVDDIKAQPGMPREAIIDAENDLVERADLVFVTSLNLLEVHKAVNANTWYFPNVADFDHFAKASLDETVVPADLAAISGPRIGLIGAISGYKVDFDLLREVAERRPNWSLVLIGEVGEGDPWTDISTISALPNVHLLGGRAYRDLPAYLKGLDVAILANRSNEYTRSMFPMKFFEYLASGRPVVATPLPALVEYANVALFCDGPDAFIEGVETALNGDGPDILERLAAAKLNTYSGRTDKMMNIVENFIHGAG